MTWLERIPKVELHVHLEGAIPLPALWELVQKYGGDPNVPNLAALRDRFRYRDFPHFLETWRWKNHFLREPEDFGLIAEAAAQDWAAQNIRYVEAFYSPTDFALDTQAITQAIRAGLDHVPEVKVALICDLVRDNTPQRAAFTLSEIAEVQHLGVIGIGIGGAEHLHPPAPFGPAYNQAREMGLHTTAHAGEAAGPASIWDAIRCLQVERIGHGTRAIEDPALVDHLAESQIPIEMCPLSNVRTGVTPSFAQHPVRDYVARGLLVTINTDDPKMFGNSLAEEYGLLQTEMGMSDDDIRALILNSIAASWLPDQAKAELERSYLTDPAWSAS